MANEINSYNQPEKPGGHNEINISAKRYPNQLQEIGRSEIPLPATPPKTSYKPDHKDTFQFLIPENLAMWLKKVEQEPPSNITGFSGTHLRYIIYLICTRTADDGYSYLKMEYLRRVVSRADDYVKYLRERGIIVRSANYKAGVHSYGYRFTVPGPYISYALDDPKFLWKIRKAGKQTNNRKCQKNIKQSVKQTQKRKYAAQCRLIERMTIDPEASKFANSFYSSESLNYAVAAIIKIKNKDYIHKTDSTSGRFHSNITNLPKELRRFVRVKGIQLIANVDIKNSQPYFSVLLLINPRKVARFAKSESLRKLLMNLKIPDNDDVKQYIDLATTGLIYEFLWDEFHKLGLRYHDKGNHKRPKYPDRQSIKDEKEYDKIRQIVKKTVYTILFDQNRQKPSQAKLVFKELFPTVDAIFSLIRGNEPGRDKFENYKRFSILLQTIESHVILDKIYLRLLRELPDTMILTIHDSIMCSQNPEKIFTMIQEKLTKFVGKQPNLKIETIKNQK